MADLPDELRAALATRLAAEPVDRLRSAVARLMDAYRSGQPATTPILAGSAEIAAYAAYRMPATYAAVRAAIGALPPALPVPMSLADLGGGTGAAAWAVADAFRSIERITVLDQVEGALALGAALAAAALAPAMRSATWRRSFRPRFRPSCRRRIWSPISYVLGELGRGGPTRPRLTCGGRRWCGRDRRARYAGRLRPGDRRSRSIARTRPSGARALPTPARVPTVGRRLVSLRGTGEPYGAAPADQGR